MSPARHNLSLDLARDWDRLLSVLKEHDSMWVAFSGGTDSSLLLAAAKEALGPKVKAALCVGDITPPWEIDAAREMAAGLGVELMELDLAELDDPAIAANDSLRCYHCKRLRLSRLKELAAQAGVSAVAEGSHADDDPADRPGSRAVAELGVISPLARAGLGKARIRELSRALGLASADMPSGACLATRIPTGRALDREALARVARAEAAVRGLIPGQVRVRDEFPRARLVLDPGRIAQAAATPLRGKLLAALRQAGYEGVSLDLVGYDSDT